MLKDKQEHLVIGLGEVGMAISSVLQDGNNKVVGFDRKGQRTDQFDVIHICFPYSRHFKKQVRAYVARYLKIRGLVIIHSTIPVGITEKLGIDYVHSPVRGVHPHLYEGVKTFTKFFGGFRAEAAAKIFKSCGVKSVEYSLNPRDTELLKLMDTTYYGLVIIFNKWVMRKCRKLGADFHFVYTLGNDSYNDGYSKLGRKDVVRPVLKYMSGPIGGHCVIPNCKLLGGVISRVIIYLNRIFGKMK